MNPWEEIKLKVNLVEVFQEYVEVKQVGSTYKCVCPFHNDKTPSLIISPEKGLWHCFGCGAGGDVFRFVMDIENLSKAESLKKLAAKAGINLTKISQPVEKANTEQNKTYFQSGLDYLAWSSQVYHKILLKYLADRTNSISQYLLSRGFNSSLVETFQIGLAPRDNFLHKLALQYKLDLDLLKAVGLLKQNSSGDGLKDSFVSRLMLPIWNNYGQVVGFTGRVLPGDKNPNRPKYLNTGQTDWFHKSELWYGWHLHQTEIRKHKASLILEGNMDVIAAHKAGFKFALASQGTSFSETQLHKLKLLTKTIWLAFDNDQAGQTSAKKLYLQATAMGFEVFQVEIPFTYKDLDEWLLESKEPIEKLPIKPFLESYLKKLENQLTSPSLQSQKAALSDYFQLLKNSDELTIEHYLQKISQLTGKSGKALYLELQKFDHKKFSYPSNVNRAEVQELNENNGLFLTWQQIATWYLFGSKTKVEQLNEDQELSSDLNILFNLLKKSLTKLKNYDALEKYLDEEKNNLEMIFEADKEKFAALDPRWLGFIRQHLASNINLLESPEEKAYWQKLLLIQA